MKNILVIEDNPHVQDNIREILELADFQVITACNGKEGIEMINEKIPDLIICDIAMPELDGFGVLHILSKKESTRNIPFIFMTARTEKADMRKGMNLGADDYLTKPFDDTELLDAVEIRLKKVETAKKDFGYGLDGLNHLLNEVSSVNDLSDLQKEHKFRAYKKKKDIYLEGDSPTFLMYVKEGKVKTYKTNEEGKELITGIYGANDFFGYESLLEGEYMESATTMEDSVIVMIPKTDFIQLIYGNPKVSESFISMLAQKVIKKEYQLLDLAYSTVRQRTAKALLEISEKFNTSLTSDPIDISREDLANLVGTATETVIRILSEFREENVISTETGKIKIDNQKMLHQISQKHFMK